MFCFSLYEAKVDGKLIVAGGVTITYLNEMILHVNCQQGRDSNLLSGKYHISKQAIKNGEKEKEYNLAFAVISTWQPHNYCSHPANIQEQELGFVLFCCRKKASVFKSSSCCFVIKTAADNVLFIKYL